MSILLSIILAILPINLQEVVARYNRGVAPTISVVHNSATNCHTASGTSQTCVINPITSGNKLFFTMHASAGGQAVSGTAAICDGTWTLDTPDAAGVFSATSTATGSGSCTVTLTGTLGFLDLLGVEIGSSTGIDVRGSTYVNQGFKTANTAFNCPAITTATNGDMVICGYYDTDGNNGTATAGSGFTIAVVGDSGGPNIRIETGIQTSAGSITPTWAGNTTNSTPNSGTISYKP